MLKNAGLWCDESYKVILWIEKENCGWVWRRGMEVWFCLLMDIAQYLNGLNLKLQDRGRSTGLPFSLVKHIQIKSRLRVSRIRNVLTCSYSNITEAWDFWKAICQVFIQTDKSARWVSGKILWHPNVSWRNRNPFLPFGVSRDGLLKHSKCN